MFAKMSFVWVPDTYWKPLDLALPIWGTLPFIATSSTPLDDVCLSYKLIVLNASTSPDTKPTSGEP